MEPTTYLLIAVSSGQAILLTIGAIVAGAAATWVVFSRRKQAEKAQLEREAAAARSEAEREAENLLKSARIEAREEYVKQQEQFRTDTEETRRELKESEKRITKREDNLEMKLDTLSTKERNLEREETRIAELNGVVAQQQEEAGRLVAEQRDRLVKVSGMSVEDARQTLLQITEKDVEHDCAVLVEKLLTEARDNAAEQAREITLIAIQRYAAEHTSESTVSTVDIPSDDMKGRVIGREGRNIRAFEKSTGVDVIVDDTPGVVVVSSFNPVRREVARLSLEKLIQDGRIHPGRIEEVVEEIRKQVDNDIMEIGKRATMEANIGGLHRKLIDLLGRLKYRTSYGQNVLRHSIEVAFLCQIMADELGLDGRLARRCGLLHDIGKAVDHEIEGGHPQIGADICKRFNERPEVLNAIAGHHGDIESISPYTPLVMAADAISASRPGGRRESLERYVQRLEQLESIATRHSGVAQAYVIQAGREIRVIVDAKQVDDAVAASLARDIAKGVEEEMTYPGEVKVTVLREMRAVEFAR